MQSMDNTAVLNLEDKSKDTSGDDGTSCSELKSKKPWSLVSPHHDLILNVTRLKAYDSFLRDMFSIHNKIPRHVVTLDEKYLRRCLESIHINAAQCSIYVNLCSVKLDLLDEQLDPTSLELTAIVVRDHCPENLQPKVSGWGLNFLDIDTLEAPVGSCNALACSASMNVLISAGIHGGPIIKTGGSSSLVKRWRYGGHCDCGGWDMGCPLTILESKSSKRGSPPNNFSVQGLDHGAPAFTISNVRDGLYFIDFESTLSALQSFSIAVAYIHTRSPSLRLQNVQRSR